MHGRRKCAGFWWKNPKKEHLEDQGVDGMMISEWILGRLGGGGVKWIQLAQVRGWWQAVVNTVMPLWVLAPCSYLVSYAHKYIIKKFG
jgi:hypothetical protein